ncbi:MOSC domain-containing protein [Thermoactinospora rubra]|uniref:MOSC domain-containing protein n=1 Tax=Thermoactinospora rubra TaxID=1088767 RepID=UPI000A114945|nr:MOSC N-terminal beta barrel domain-containing protein [Thermoactinospora rubra]
MRLASVHIYPIKSTMGHDVASAEVEPWGLAGDRRYMVTGEDGELLTAREHPRLLACRAEPTGGTLTLTGPHAEPLRVLPAGRTSLVNVWRTAVELTDCGEEAAAWLSALLGRPARLKWLDDPTRRPVDPEYGTPRDRVSLADGYPLLLASTASMARLNDWIAEQAAERGEEVPEPLPISRFRPNLVVDGVAEPFAEDRWKRVRVGEVDFRVVKPCDRCVLTTIDARTLAKGKEPIRTLSRHRRWDGKVWFGMNLIPDGTGRISIGDPVIPL